MPDLVAADLVEEDSTVVALEGEDLVEEVSEADDSVAAVSAVAVLEAVVSVAEEVSEVETKGVEGSEANSEVEELGVVNLAEAVSEASASLAVISEPVGIGAPVVARAASARAETLPVTARTSSRGTEEWIKDNRTDRTGAARISRTVRAGVVKISRTVRTGAARISKTVKMHMMTTGMTTGMAPTIPVAAGTDGVDIIVDWHWALV
jgi:hypothetical protein